MLMCCPSAAVVSRGSNARHNHVLIAGLIAANKLIAQKLEAPST
jgi:hypothetical protein